MSTIETDRQAWEAHEAGQTWAAVAEAMHYANGSVARRAAMRHAARIGTVPVIEDQHIDPIIPEPRLEEPADDGRPSYREGQLLYHRSQPKAKFRFVKWNRDGSAGVWGGEPSREAYHDYRVDVLTPHPLNGSEAVFVWAERNLHTEFTIDELAENLGVVAAVIRKTVTDRPDIFRRKGRSTFEVRDPEADRQADQKEMVAS